MTDTTPVNGTPEIRKLHNGFESLITFYRDRATAKKTKFDPATVPLSLTRTQYIYYCSQLKGKFTGKIYFKGIEVKKMGEV